MAKRTVVTLVDDLDHSLGADETVTFALDGVSYEIDLSSGNAAALRDSFAMYVAHATRVGGRRSAGKAPGSGKRADLAAVRDWARAAGHNVNDRGRISANVLAAYDAAH